MIFNNSSEAIDQSINIVDINDKNIVIIDKEDIKKTKGELEYERK